MLALGYANGTHYVTIERMADGRNELLRGMAEELVRAKVDLISAAPSNAVEEANAPLDGPDCVRGGHGVKIPIDRKSTRLNSSH